MAKIKSVNGSQAFFCLGCKALHLIDTRWVFNYNHEKPTFKPDCCVMVGPMPEGHPFAGRSFKCHFTIVDGVINYMADSTHDMKGMSLHLPDFEEMAKVSKFAADNRTPENVAILEET